MEIRKLLALIVALFLAACGPLQANVTRTPTASPPATADARGTADAEFNALVIATATALHLTAIAATPGTTQEPTGTFTGTAVPGTVAAPAPVSTETPAAGAPTLAPTSAPFPTVLPSPLPGTAVAPAGQPAVLSFTVDRPGARPGESVTLAWTTTGGETASLDQGICCLNNGGNETQSVPPNGSLVVKLEGAVERDRLNFWLEVRNASGTASAQQHVDLPCPDVYFFSVPAAGLPCPASPPVTLSAAEQVFEHGRMLWLKPSGTIYVLYGDGSPKASGQPPDGFVQYPDTWQEGQPESDPSLTPPPGQYQPIRGFGKIWRASERDNLGWALGPEQAFDSLTQRPWNTCRHRNAASGAVVNCSGADGNHEYLRAADGRLILLTGFLNHTPQHWEWVNTP